ncbi:hypothetical protein FA13DRAFT_1696666 [Coprinellus micaceus]|uniref:G domain-containing protein n=1 Tax=Coprinellus micaceus TaxID=71717 RepID=A0A4Y7SFD9_COPMI|nr:hypothetical protein FA13DRAFT_1696666 [Coprinellus micaceus]
MVKSAPGDPTLALGNKDDIVFALMGQTKAGKSSLINRIYGAKVRRVGEEMISCTKQLESVAIEEVPQYVQDALRGRRIVLLDTPGFDDTDVGDDEILIRIANWLETSLSSRYCKGMLVGGVLYLHDTTKDGWTGASRRNLNLFSKICGDDAMNLVRFLTTKWGNVPDTQLGNAERRIKELKEKHWQPLIAHGAAVHHLDPPRQLSLPGGIQDPWVLIHQMLVSMNARQMRDRILLLQRELVKERRFLIESKAGRELSMSLEDLLARAKALQRAAREDGVSSVDKEALQERQRQIDELTRQIGNLTPALSKRLKRWVWNVLGFS